MLKQINRQTGGLLCLHLISVWKLNALRLTRLTII